MDSHSQICKLKFDRNENENFRKLAKMRRPKRTPEMMEAKLSYGLIHAIDTVLMPADLPYIR